MKFLMCCRLSLGSWLLLLLFGAAVAVNAAEKEEHGRRHLSATYSYSLSAGIDGDGGFYGDPNGNALTNDDTTTLASGYVVAWTRVANAGPIGTVTVSFDIPNVLTQMELFWTVQSNWGLLAPSAFSVEIIRQDGGDNLGPWGPFPTGADVDCSGTRKFGSNLLDFTSLAGFEHVKASGAIVTVHTAGGGSPGGSIATDCSGSNMKNGISEIDFVLSEPVVSPPGSGGDPHFTSWSSHRYDYHGHCDLLLLKSPKFGRGKQEPKQPEDQGLAIHIRSAPYRAVYSYISDIAIQIRDNILEIGEGGKHSINGEPQRIGATKRLSGYPVGSMVTKNGRHVYRVHLGDFRAKDYHGQEITIREYKSWISVIIHHANPEDFQDSIGLMGAYPDGTWYGRDGVTIHNDIDEFGSDWIVRGDLDGFLFHEPSRFPDKCALPSKDVETKRRRRLDEASVTRAAALNACAQWPQEARDDCVMDVMISEDVNMALNGPF